MALNLNKVTIGRKILLVAIVCGVLGALNLFQPLALGLYALQTKVAVKPVSGDIVVVGIDSASIDAVGRWPWPRDKQAELLRKIDGYAPAAIYLDIGYQGRTTAYADNRLRNTLETLKAPTKVIALAARSENDAARSIFSHPAVVGSTDVVSASLPYLFGFVWDAPISIPTERGPLISLAGSIADLDPENLNAFPVDYAFDPKSVPLISSVRIFDQTADPNSLKGKTIILGVTDPTQNDIHSMPGWGDQPGVIFHALAAETLKSGIPVSWGWFYFFAFAFVICAVQLTRRGLQYSKYICWAAALAILSASTWLATLNSNNDPMPALALIAAVGTIVSRQKAALIRSQRNAATGFFNMTGYLVEEVVSNALFIGATLMRAETRLGYVRQEDEIAIMKEVGHRLSTVIDEQQLTHNDNQQFLWEMPSIATSKLAHYLEGLRLLFAEPLVINGRKIDIDIYFGVDRNVNKNIKSRMESALAASIDASLSRSSFTIATTADFDSVLQPQFTSEFETAMNNGDIELVLEAQQNLGDGQVRSAAAALRWTHPAYGQINTTKLFAMARHSGNLKTVSTYLCAQAIMAAGHLVKQQSDFAVNVKISPAMLLDDSFAPAMLQHISDAKCQPSNLTFEVIDLHDYKLNDAVRVALQKLQMHGFRIGISNFGTTDADMDFINTFQPDEIFLAKSFCAELLGSTSSAIFAVGALRIAKAKHIITTANGIDDRDVLTALRRHACDKGKGKIIAIPLNLLNFCSIYFTAIHSKVG